MEYYQDQEWLNTPVKLYGAEKWDALDRNVIENKFVANVNGQDVVYIDTLNYWVPRVSTTFALRAMQIMDNKNASTNYEAGFSAYTPRVAKAATAISVNVCPQSVCIGTKRLVVTWSGSTGMLKFDECPPLIDIPTDSQNTTVPMYVYAVCSQPAGHIALPTKFQFPNVGAWLAHILPFFPSKMTLATYLWCIGNCIVDPVSKPKFVLLCGPGGSGKSTVIRGAMAALLGCCSLLPDNVLSSTTDSAQTDVAKTIADSRLAVCFELNLVDKKVNMSTLKNVTGGDYVKINSQMTRALCSLMVATNGLPDHELQPEYSSDALMRRMVCVEMKVTTSNVDSVPDPNDIESRLDLLCNAIAVRLMYKHMPIKPTNVLLTLCGSKYFEACSYIQEDLVNPVSYSDGLSVLALISAIVESPPEEIINRARFISPSCLGETCYGWVIMGLKPLPHKL